MQSKIICDAAQQTDHPDIFKCTRGWYGGLPHIGVCQYCLKQNRQPPIETADILIDLQKRAEQDARAAKRLEICKSCDKWEKDTGKCSLISGCGNCHRKRICPNNPPKWGLGIDE